MIFLRLFVFFVPLIPNGDHLLFNRITIQPTQAEFLSIYNPTSDTLDMSNYYLTDATRSSSDDYYYNLGSGENFWSENFKDFPWCKKDELKRTKIFLVSCTGGHQNKKIRKNRKGLTFLRGLKGKMLGKTRKNQPQPPKIQKLRGSLS